MTNPWDDDLASRWAPTLALLRADQAARQIHDETWQHSGENTFREDVAAGAEATKTVEHTGVMIALFPDESAAAELAITDGEPPDELHVTLAFLGDVDAEVLPEQEESIIEAVRTWARTQTPIAAHTNGIGVFDADPPVTYANIDSPQLPAARHSLVETLEARGLAPLQNHGFTPHMTLDYTDRRSHQVPQLALHFTTIVVAFAGRRTILPLEGSLPIPAPRQAAVLTERTAPQGPPPDTIQAQAETQALPRAFEVEINGKQLLTGPAVALSAADVQTAGMREPSLEEIASNPMMWMRGRFVGANEANRNGAYWSAGDLELAGANVAHGPLNWLHEARHIIGSISSANFVAAETADGQMIQPHIAATAGIWKWIWPDEAYVVQQASDVGRLWYSMECISQQVTCSGPNGCGNTTSYGAYMSGAACEHVTQRSSVRQFNRPTFLGGAVIVPPTQPGWAAADARVTGDVMRTAESLAEAAFHQSYQGQDSSQVSTSAWETLMAQLITYAQS